MVQQPPIMVVVVVVDKTHILKVVEMAHLALSSFDIELLQQMQLFSNQQQTGLLQQVQHLLTI
jgi:hypothetical protein